MGNLLVERMAGAHVHLVSKEEYARVGQVKLAQLLAAELIAAGKKPYIVPVGGSSPLGTWGYLDAVDELHQQAGPGAFTDIVMVPDRTFCRIMYMRVHRHVAAARRRAAWRWVPTSPARPPPCV